MTLRLRARRAARARSTEERHVPSRDLAARFEAYGDWRRRLSSRHLAAASTGCDEQDLADAQVDLQGRSSFSSACTRTSSSSRSSPSSRAASRSSSTRSSSRTSASGCCPRPPGRTTMCPTELLYDAVAPAVDPPAADRDAHQGRDGRRVQELRRRMGDVRRSTCRPPRRWARRLSRVSQVKRVPVALARKYGLYRATARTMIVAALEHGDEGSVDIPCWRHAIINFPHPLLQQGLVILDTPGLNAIGTEPELTLNLLPQRARAAVHPGRRRRRDARPTSRSGTSTWPATIRRRRPGASSS